jgi:hypothetical protein
MLRNFSEEQFDIVIQAGQSNSEGCGLGETTTPFNSTDDIWFLNNDFSLSKAREEIWGNDIVGNFSLSFCTKYIEDGRLDKSRKLLVIRAAIGGTGFLDNHWKLQDDLFLRMMEMIKTATELNSKNKLVAFLWHQGENDAALNASKQEHFNNLSTLVNTVRNTFHCDSLPFIAGDFVNQWKTDNLEMCEPVISAMKDVCTSIGNAKFIETSELQSNEQKVGNGDTIHFCREAINQLGVKYYDAFSEISSVV